MKIMLSAGEASGDLHGAELAKEIKKLSPETELMGFGGENMEAAGVVLRRNFRNYNIMGVGEVIANLRRILRLLSDLADIMADERPDLLVLIDYPDFNWRLAKKAKALGIPVFSYIPPSAWAWRRGRAKSCAAVAAEFVSIFPFELAPYEEAGAKISFLGNPLVDKVKMSMDLLSAREFFSVAENEPMVLLMPGSRAQEIARNFEPMLKAAKILLDKRPNTRFFLPLAAGIDERGLTEKIKRENIQVALVRSHRYDLMGIADLAIATSGTVIMEAALLSLPCVVLYQMSKFNYFIGKMLVHIDHISLPNILLGRRAQPELLQDEVEPGRIAAEALELYRGMPKREKTVADLAEACRKLGAPGAAKRIAARILACAADFADEKNNGKGGQNHAKL